MVSRVVMSAAAVCAFAALLVGSPIAGADPVSGCGDDQATALDWALAHEQHDLLTQAPWSRVPVASNYDACADLSAVLVTIDNPRATSPRQVLLFHRGSYIGTAATKSRPYTTLDLAASTKDTVVVVYTYGRTCSTCSDGTTTPVRVHWNGVTAVVVDVMPPVQEWP